MNITKSFCIINTYQHGQKSFTYIHHIDLEGNDELKTASSTHSPFGVIGDETVLSADKTV